MFTGRLLLRTYTVLVSTSFLGALCFSFLNFEKLVRNEFYGWPDEFIPSVSAVVGDGYPARAWFQFGMALTAPVRVMMLCMQLMGFHSLMGKNAEFKNLFQWTSYFCLLHLLFNGAWIYITSSDHQSLHEVCMILYLFFTIIYHYFCAQLKSALIPGKLTKTTVMKLQAILCSILVGMIYFFYKHRVHAVPSAYSIYAALEWTLLPLIILTDISIAENIITEMTLSLNNLPKQAAICTATKKVETAMEKNNSFLLLMSNALLSYAFWSLWPSLAVTLWYFPLWQLGYSGAEVALLCHFSVILLASSFIRQWFRTHRTSIWIICLVQGFLLSANLSWPWGSIEFSPIIRLMHVTCSVSLLLPLMFNDLHSGIISIEGFHTGLALQLIVRIAFCTMNPLWPILNETNGGYQKWFCLLFLICLLYENKQNQQNNRENVTVVPISLIDALCQGVQLGALLFLVHAFLTDGSTIQRWVVQGFPRTAGESLLASIVTTLIVIVSLYDKFDWKMDFIHHWCISNVLCLVFYYAAPKQPLAALLCGWIWLFWICRVLKQCLYQFRFSSRIAWTLLVAMIVYLSLFMAILYTVAYAFVPMGEYFREKSGMVLFVASICIGLGGVTQERRVIQLISNNSARRTVIILFTLLFVAVLIRIFSSTYYLQPRFVVPRMDQFDIDFDWNHFQNNSILSSVRQLQGFPVLNAAIWTIHFGLDDQLQSSHVRMKRLIEKMDLDLVGLLESDTQRMITGNRDVVQWLGEHLHMFIDYGPATRNHTWGCALLSRYPIMESKHHLLPSPQGELACAIQATIQVQSSMLLEVWISHNGQEETRLDRLLQTKTIVRELKNVQRPVLFLGYVVTKPHRDFYLILMRQRGKQSESPLDGAVFDIDPEDDDRWCQYIGYRGPFIMKLAYARLSHAGISDTEMQIGKFALLPQHSAHQKENAMDDVLAAQKVIQFMRQNDLKSLPFAYRRWWFPEEFLSEWHGHSYHWLKHFWLESNETMDDLLAE